jgi:hypothetical protein
MPETEPAAAAADPQCPCLVQRIDELLACLHGEAESARRRHWRRQLELVTERARRLGCFEPDRLRGPLGPPPP